MANEKINENIVEFMSADDRIKLDKLPPKEELNFVQERLISTVSGSPSGVPANLDITDEKWTQIERDIEKMFDAVQTDRTELDSKMVEWQLAIQGEPTDADYSDEPFEDSCKLRSTITATTCRIVANKITGTLLVEPYYLAEVKGDKEKEARLRDYANQKCKHDFDFRETVRDIASLTTESPVAIIVPERVREVRRDTDYEIYKTFNEFKAKYPNAKSARMSESDYKQKLEVVKADTEGGDDNFHECLFEIDVVSERSVANVVHLVNFVKFPFSSGSIEDAKLVGYKMDKTYDQLVRLELDGQLKNVVKLKKAFAPEVESPNEDAIKTVQEEKTGVNSSPPDIREDFTTKIYKVYKGLIRLTFDTNELEKDYEFWYAMDEKVLLRLAPTIDHYKKRNFIVATIWKKTNSWLGECLAEQAENPQIVLDTLLRQLIDGNSISNVPEYIFDDREKKNFDRTRQGYKHKVGRIWWLKNPNAFQQIKAQRPDGAQFLSIMQYIAQDQESRSGASRTAAGQPIAGDPDAPGVKTMALLQQSDFMISQYISNLRPAFDEMMKHFIKQDRQKLKNKTLKLTRFDPEGRTEEEEIDRDMLQFIDSETKFILRNQKVDDNQTSRMADSRQELELLAAFPIIGNRPQSMAVIIRRHMMNNDRWTIEEIDEVVPSEDTIKQEQVEIQQAAIQAEAAKQQQEQLVQGMTQQAEEQEAQITQAIEQS